MNICLSGIATALQGVTANPAPKPHRISDVILRNWEGSNDKGEFRHFMSDLHVWMHAWSTEGVTMLVSVESSHTYDDSTFSVDCSQEQFITIEASLYQVPQRATANEPRRTVSSASTRTECMSLISNISDRDRAKDAPTKPRISDDTVVLGKSVWRLLAAEACAKSSESAVLVRPRSRGILPAVARNGPDHRSTATAPLPSATRSKPRRSDTSAADAGYLRQGSLGLRNVSSATRPTWTSSETVSPVKNLKKQPASQRKGR